MLKLFASLALAMCLGGCQSVAIPDAAPQDPLFEQLGGLPGLEQVADRFVRLVIIDPRIERHFKDTNLERFHDKLIEHLCQISDGGCDYTGDDMPSVHTGMNISELEFNAVVENLQIALNDANIPLSAQNRLLARLAPMRENIIYR